MISTPAVATIMVNGMSSEERRAAFLERIKAKESATLESQGGGEMQMEAVIDPASEAAVMPDSAEDKGGGVWNCLFAGEEQFPEVPVVNTDVNTIDRRVAATSCKGKYRIKVKWGSMSG